MTSKKNSRSGIALTKANDLTAKELGAIIKLCQLHGVSQLSYKGLQVSFGEQRPLWEEPRKPVKGSGKKSVDQGAIDKSTFEQEEFTAIEQKIAELVISDPAQYEHLMEIGELENDRKSSGSEDDDEGTE